MQKRAGFTLIEISIVMVIIGLIVGAILAGTTMIESNRLRQLHGEVQQAILAINTFKVKYNCIPGDCAYATSLFPAGTCGNQITSDGPTASCNGDGNGQILGTGGGNSYWFQPSENFYLWRILKASNLYQADITATSQWCRGFKCGEGWAGENVPGMKFSTNAILYVVDKINWEGGSFVGWSTGWGASITMPFNYSNALAVGAKSPGGGGTGLGPSGVLSPNQAQLIDTKYDDGYFNAGKIVGAYYPYSSCTSAASATPVVYRNSASVNSCGLVYLKAF